MYVLPTHRIYVFCVDLRTNRDNFLIQNLTGRFLYQRFNPLQPSGHYMYHQFYIQQFYVLHTQCIYVFCVDLRTYRDYFSIQNLTCCFLYKRFNTLQPSGHYMYHQFNIQLFYVLHTQYIYVFCVDLRTNRDYFSIQNLTGCFLYQRFNPLQPSGHYMYHQFNIQQFYVLPTQCIYVFCVDLRTNSDYFSIHH